MAFVQAAGVHESRRQYDDHVVHTIVPDKRAHAALENRAAADLEQLLRHSRAKAATLTGRRNDRRYMHG